MKEWNSCFVKGEIILFECEKKKDMIINIKEHSLYSGIKFKYKTKQLLVFFSVFYIFLL